MADQQTKRHISFRLDETTVKQIKDLKSLFGLSEGAIIEKVVEAYYINRREYAEQYMKQKLESTDKK